MTVDLCETPLVMHIIGLTGNKHTINLLGGIATGKSTASKILAASPCNLPIVDADVIARKVVEPGTWAYKRIVDHFGREIVLSDGSIDRKALGKNIFENESERKMLNSIVHPAVRYEIVKQVIYLWLVKGEALCVLDVPLLFEGGLDVLCAQTLVIDCRETLQLERLLVRDKEFGSNEDDAKNRIRSQGDMKEKRERADVVVDNNSDKASLEKRLVAFVAEQRPSILVVWLYRFLPFIGLCSGLWIVIQRLFARKRAIQRYREEQSKKQ